MIGNAVVFGKTQYLKKSFAYSYCKFVNVSVKYIGAAFKGLLSVEGF
jgi:hypothetical protein